MCARVRWLSLYGFGNQLIDYSRAVPCADIVKCDCVRVEYRVSDDFLNGCVCTRNLDAITFTLHDAANRSALCSRAGGRRRLHNDLYGNGKRDRVSLPHFLHLLHARAEPSRFQPTVHSPLGAQLCESC